MKKIIGALLGGSAATALLLVAVPAEAAPGDRAAWSKRGSHAVENGARRHVERSERRATRVERRDNRRAERREARSDRRSEARNERRDRRRDMRGERRDRRAEVRSDRMDRRGEARAERIDRRRQNMRDRARRATRAERRIERRMERRRDLRDRERRIARAERRLDRHRDVRRDRRVHRHIDRHRDIRRDRRAHRRIDRHRDFRRHARAHRHAYRHVFRRHPHVRVFPRRGYNYRPYFWGVNLFLWDNRYRQDHLYRTYYRPGYGYYGPVSSSGWRVLYPWLADDPTARHWVMWNFDDNRNGRLSKSEARRANREFEYLADFDRNGRLSRWEIDDALLELRDEYRYSFHYG